MALVSDVTTAHTTGLNHIDALLDDGPAWNYMTPAGNTLSYTFSISAGNELDPHNIGSISAFSASQQANTRSLLAYISAVTGIVFTETTDGNAARLHFAMTDIGDSGTSGLCSWNSSYNFDSQNNLTAYTANAYVYLDNVEWGDHNRVLTPGGNGYETLLHEMGHALGLKHPFDGVIHLPNATDNTANTLMSYSANDGPYTSYRPYDLAALNWLYGRDGLGGKLGLNSVNDGRYLMGSAAADNLTTGAGNDILVGLGGADVLDGGSGFDTALYASARSNFTLSNNGNSFTLTDRTGALGSDILLGIERINFSDKVIAFDVDGDAGKAYRLYQAAFDRTPDQGGLGFWINALSKNTTLQQVASGFVSSAEFTSMYGSNASPETIVSKLYDHVLHRAPEQGGFDFWVNSIKQGSSVSSVLVYFSEGAENQAQLIGTIQNGIEYTPYYS